MPIAYFYSSNIFPNQEQLDSIVIKWAEEIGVNLNNISISLIETKIQAGNKYKIMVNLYLPSLWGNKDIEYIQLTLAQLITTHLSLLPEDLFIMTSIIQSSNVIENGKVVKW